MFDRIPGLQLLEASSTLLQLGEPKMSSDTARYPWSGEGEGVKLLYDNVGLVEESNDHDQSFNVD